MKVEVTMPEDYMGDVIGDINSRRGRIEGMDDLGGGKIVRALVPLSEMFGSVSYTHLLAVILPVRQFSIYKSR